MLQQIPTSLEVPFKTRGAIQTTTLHNYRPIEDCQERSSHIRGNHRKLCAGSFGIDTRNMAALDGIHRVDTNFKVAVYRMKVVVG